ncbi:MAG TPA: tyrosine-type recombinase/integrase [Anaerolineales bacterium]|nr:tyrosine-type recombinase/integrase [Anaerolineales bacterium]
MRDPQPGVVYARNTLAAYQSDLNRFNRYIEKTAARSATLRDFTTPQLQAFLHAEIDAGFHTHTIARRIASLRAFNLFLKQPIGDWEPVSSLALAGLHQRRGRSLPTSHAAGLPASQPARLQPEHLSILWNAMEQAPQARARRDQALLAVCLETGLPLQRLLALNLADLRDNCRKLSLEHPSGAKAQVILEWADQPLRRYLKEGRPELSHQPDELALWISQAGKRMSRQAVWQALRGWGLRADLPYPISPRLLSHTAAYRLESSGLSLQQIQLRLGHQSSLSTLARLRRIAG